MRLLVSWLREFVDVTAPAEDIANRLSLRGFEVASVETLGEGDGVIDFEVTANRPDCLSVLGLAREVATTYGAQLTLPAAEPTALVSLATVPVAGTHERLTVQIDDTELCPRYAAAIADVTVGSSPAWLAARLERCGVRPINNLVDVTNYVLLELGHPMHAFDLAKLSGAALRIRRARPGERVTTLDRLDRALDPEMLVIADADRPQAVAGVMGGAQSEVSAATRTVALESAYFKPASVRRTSKRLDLKTEASARFERGADISAPVVALERAIALMQRIGAGRVLAPIVDRYPEPRPAVELALRRARLTSLLGATVADDDVVRILESLGLTVTPLATGWRVVAPTFRVDLLREIDLIEEVGRHYGFDRIASTFPPVTAAAAAPDPRIPRDRTVRQVLTAAGLSEAVTFGFIEARAAEAFRPDAGADVAQLDNPLSAKFAVLRPSLLPGLVDAVAYNRRHGQRDVGLFEVGAAFTPREGERRTVGIAWTGAAAPDHWSGGMRPVDFFDLSGVVERLLDALGLAPRFEPAHEAHLVPGQTGSVVVASGPNAGTRIGIVGQLAPPIADARDAPGHDPIFVAELDLDAIWHAAGTRPDAVRSVPRHPAVIRDLSVVVADTLPAEIIRGTIQAAGARTPAPLARATFFDRYQGKGVPARAVSLSVRLTFQAFDRTLTDGAVQQSVEAILDALRREHGAVLR